ncbi:hypothetical protein GGI42DRAFT_336290 [Trichoderma sp. SZMC 28013]
MVLNLQKIYQPSSRTYNIIARNHQDKVMAFCSPHSTEYLQFGRWLYESNNCTELSITSMFGRTASIQLEDSDWKLIVSGNIQNGRMSVDVDGSKDFDIRFTDDGFMELQCWHNESWGKGTGNIIRLMLIPFQQ